MDLIAEIKQEPISDPELFYFLFFLLPMKA